MRDPQTPAEWKEAVDFAEFARHLHSARAYGLVRGGPGVDVARAEEILRRGRGLGVLPTPGCVERITHAYLAGASAP